MTSMIFRDFGSKSWEDVQKDKYIYNFQPNFPRYSPARTTFYARQADDEEKFDELWKLHHGRGHTYEGWDTRRVRQENVFKYRRACVILSQAEVTGEVRDHTLSRLQREDLRGFSRYYNGIDGAALGFAALYRYETQAEAVESYIVTVAEDLIDVDGQKLVKYVWDNYDEVWY